MTTKLKAARDGYNVLTDNDPNHSIFDSEFNTFKIIEKVTITPSLSDSGMISVGDYLHAHGKSYIPFVIAFCKFPGGGARVAPPGTQAFDATLWFAGLQVDGTNIHFNYVNNTGGNQTFTFIYFICEVPV